MAITQTPLSVWQNAFEYDPSLIDSEAVKKFFNRRNLEFCVGDPILENFRDRMEKDDTLRLALAVGRILEENGVNAVYTRSTDVYDTPYQKAEMGNEAGADYFVSLHRNAASEPGKGSGVMTLVYKTGRESEQLADSIQRELARTGYVDLGVIERPDLIVLRKTQMPAVLVEVGFIDNPEDNKRFDAQFDEIAAAVASGILNVIDDDMDRRPVEESDYYYQIQTGAYRIRSLAEQQLEELRRMGFPAFLVYDGTYFKLRVGAFKNLDNAVRMERELRKAGFPTVLLYEREVK